MRIGNALFFTMMASTALLFATLSFRSTITSNLKRTTHLKTSSSSSIQPKTIRIFCYGDSLTAGTSPPNGELYPYAPHLENELNKLYSNDNISVVVRWRGLPGWTASAMMEYLDDSSIGLRSAINGIRDPTLSLVILLAGTNDIGMLTSSMSVTGGDNVDVQEAITPILELHKTCLESGMESGGDNEVRTLALGIPGSAWQQMNPSAQKLCNDMNESLEKFATASTSTYGGRVSFVNFPFGYERGDSKWSSDGLHLSPEGYEVLGTELAKSVKNILDGFI